MIIPLFGNVVKFMILWEVLSKNDSGNLSALKVEELVELRALSALCTLIWLIFVNELVDP